MPISSDPPVKDPLVQVSDPESPFRALTITKKWLQWLGTDVVGAVNLSPERLALDSRTDQAASISLTSVAVDIPAGWYSVATYARITQAASTSSSLTVTIHWTDGGVSQSESFPAMTGNTTATNQSRRRMIRADAGTPISISTTYSSTGATAMEYRLDTLVQQEAIEGQT